MTIQEIQRLREMRPFEPFAVLTADDKRYTVRHPENFALTGKGRLMAIAMPDESFVTVDLLLVTAIKRPISRKTNGKKRTP